MKRQVTKTTMAVCCGFTIALLSGCSGEKAAPAATAEEVKAFKGGTMPPEARRAFEKAKAEADAKRGTQPGQPATQR